MNLYTVDVIYDDSLTDTDQMEKALNSGGYPVREIIRPNTPPAETPVKEHINITALEAKALISSDDGLIIVDVREYEEFCGSDGHIPNAKNYPWNSGILQKKYSELPQEKPILAVCGTGMRSDAAARFLSEQGYTVYDMSESMDAWIWERETCDTAEPDEPSESDKPAEQDSGENTGGAAGDSENTGGPGDDGGGCFISVLFFAANMTAGEETADKSPRAFLPDPVYTFEPVVEGSEVVHDFILQNKGGETLVIENLKSG